MLGAGDLAAYRCDPPNHPFALTRSLVCQSRVKRGGLFGMRHYTRILVVGTCAFMNVTRRNQFTQNADHLEIRATATSWGVKRFGQFDLEDATAQSKTTSVAIHTWSSLIQRV